MHENEKAYYAMVFQAFADDWDTDCDARYNDLYGVKPLRGEDYPGLAKLWDNPEDDIYDTLPDKAPLPPGG